MKLASNAPRRRLLLRAAVAIVIASIFAVGEQMADVYLAHHGLSHADIIVDDVVGAVLLGVIAFLWVTVVDERHRRIRSEERRVLTSEMNHHVRNALTVIKYSAEYDNREERVRMTSDAVNRIESTLRELLPSMPPENPPE
jgi:uncharacterized protein (UPF0218 family)